MNIDITKNLIYPNSSNPIQVVSDVKKIIQKNDINNLQLDLSDMNVLDAVKVLVMLSSFLYKKLPDEKLKFKFYSNDIKNIISSFSLNNLVMV